ncbi:MAG: TolC family protein, partial [Alphaproteobacteria bacterium]|nr:TolC family protein [Alphaproteobacteria bacterium]
MRKTPALALALALCAFGARANDNCPMPAGTLDLQTVIELGLCRNPNTAASFYGVRQSRMQRYAGMAEYLPTVRGEIGARQIYRQSAFGGWSDTMSSASLSASWLIFDFGRRESDVAALNAVWRATGLEHSSAVQNFIFDMVSAYYGLLIANAEVTAATELVAVAQSAKNVADTRFRAGAVARADVLRADTTLAQRQLELQRARGTEQIASGQLLFLMSFPQYSEIQIADMPLEFGGTGEQRIISEMIVDAQSRRGSIRAREEQMNAAWHRRNAAFLRNMPSISLAGTLQYDF